VVGFGPVEPKTTTQLLAFYARQPTNKNGGRKHHALTALTHSAFVASYCQEYRYVVQLFYQLANQTVEVV
jgi:hypothetical protein